MSLIEESVSPVAALLNSCGLSEKLILNQFIHFLEGNMVLLKKSGTTGSQCIMGFKETQ